MKWSSLVAERELKESKSEELEFLATVRYKAGGWVGRRVHVRSYDAKSAEARRTEAGYVRLEIDSKSLLLGLEDLMKCTIRT